jgi:hypothetical protein
VQVSLNRLVITGASDKVVFIFSELPAISMSSNMGLMYDKILLADRDTFYVEVEYPTSHRVMNALYALQQNAIKQKKEIAEYDARFAASLADYRNKAAANAALPEDANRYKVQAEGAVRDKEFNDAADYYAAALKIAQWWPVGHFNRALVLGETGDYDMAKREMNYYLQLVPNAPNARAAQDKIYDWARLDSK